MTPDRYDLPVTYLDTPERLARALPDLFAAPLLAVDIECSLTGVHGCRLALLQIASEDQTWLVDPLPLDGVMRPFLRALARTPWIVHDFSGDGVVFKRLYDVVPGSVLDTMMLARALGYPQPGLKTMALLKLGISIPKEEQDSNWMLRPLRDSQLSYAARDASLLLPLLRALAKEAGQPDLSPESRTRVAHLPREMRALLSRIRAYRPPAHEPIVGKVHAMGLGALAEARAHRLSQLRRAWGNDGDVAAVMEMGNRWILERLSSPPRSREALERTIPNPRFRKRRLDDLWAVFDPDGHAS